MGCYLSFPNGEKFSNSRVLDINESASDLFSVEESKPKKYCKGSSMRNVLTDNSAANSLLPTDSKAIHISAWKQLPLPLKAPQGIFIGNSLFIRGGYTMSLTKSSDIYVGTDSSDSWTLIPPLTQELKLSSLTPLGHKLVLLGGKEYKSNSWMSTLSNRVEVWDTERNIWEEPSSLPPMIAPRVSPVVVRHDSYIIVAGGNSGILDYKAELLDTSASPMRWIQCPNLPLQCNSKTSAVAGNRWYLLDSNKGDVFYTELDSYINLTISNHRTGSRHTLKDAGWHKLPSKPSEDAVIFKLSALGPYLIAFTNVRGKLVMHMLQDDNTWLTISGQALPWTIYSAALLLNREAEDTLLVLGGENSASFSDKTYKVSLTTSTRLKEIKRKWGVTLNTQA